MLYDVFVMGMRSLPHINVQTIVWFFHKVLDII